VDDQDRARGLVERRPGHNAAAPGPHKVVTADHDQVAVRAAGHGLVRLVVQQDDVVRRALVQLLELSCRVVEHDLVVGGEGGPGEGAAGRRASRHPSRGRIYRWVNA